MSILDFPRLNFRGIFKCDPCTANNDDVLPAVVTRDTSQLGNDLNGMTDDQALQFLTAPVDMQNYDNPPGINTYIRTGWNPMGDHTTTFEQTTITTAVTGPGVSAQDPICGIGFEIIGTPNPDGTRPSTPMIVDLDPTGLVSTQIFIGGIRFFTMQGGVKTVLAEAHYDTRAYQDWLNFCATVPTLTQPYAGEQNFVGIACTWQFVIPASALPPYSAFGINSPALQALLNAAQSGGLAVRFKTYEVEPGYTDGYLAAAFGQGQSLHNPAYGYLIGTIGIWNADEPRTEPAGRKLEAYYSASNPNDYGPVGGRPAMSWSANSQVPATSSQCMPGAVYPWMGAPALIGNAVAKVHSDQPVISLDIVESFPKYGFRNPNGPTTNNPPQGFDQPKQKAYVGDVFLAVVPAAGGDPIAIADVDYGYPNFSTYEDFGGIVDLTYDPSVVSADTIANGQLLLMVKGDSVVNAGLALVAETQIRVVTDDRTAYLMPDGTGYALNVKVYERGGPTSQPTVLYLNEYKTIVQLKPNTTDNCAPATANQYRTNQSVDSRTELLTVPTGEDNPPQCPPPGPKPELPRVIFPASVTIPAGTTGWYPIPIAPNTDAAPEGGTAVLALQQENSAIYGTIPPATPGGTPGLGVSGVPMWSTKTYCSVRVFEKADFSSLYNKAGEVQWADVYTYALRYYYLLFPAMSAYIPLNSPSAITSPYAAKLIQQRLGTPADPVFLTTLNMPVTRTLSPARVNLVLDFIKQSQDKAGGG